LYYDCTNFFFEIEEAEGLKQYGYSKDHKPNPTVQMGLFMDGDGIPLAFSIHKGNDNEQTTLLPLEEKIISDFALSKFVVCTDAGLSAHNSRVFNDKGGRAFVTVQSIKKLKKFLKEWALDSNGWQLPGDKELYDISNLDKSPDEDGYMDPEAYYKQVFYKERWINEDGLEQRLIVTYSIKYRDYLRKIRANHIERAQKLIEHPRKLSKSRPNDYKRFVAKKNMTVDGKEAKKTVLSLDNELIAKEELYDGFYGVCTNLEDNVEVIIRINKRRWMIEESFRIMKNEFKARPVYLQRDDRIKAHFVICFISLMIFRFLEKHLKEQYTCSEIINGLREMDFLRVEGEGYIPTYTRTDLTDDLHEVFGFRTDYQIVTNKQMKAVFKAAMSSKSIK
jgi:transposase